MEERPDMPKQKYIVDLNAWCELTTDGYPEGAPQPVELLSLHNKEHFYG
jgi:hypothetical protein